MLGIRMEKRSWRIAAWVAVIFVGVIFLAATGQLY